MARRYLHTAHHEAAHAVVGEDFGRRVKRLEISKVGTTLGRCVYQRRPNPRSFGPLRQAIETVAGSAAEQLWHREPRWYISRGDLKLVKSQGFRGADLDEITDLARVHVALRKREIQAVARALLERDLAGVEVRAIISKVRRRRRG